MLKTDTFFVIDNFNTVPTELLTYCKNYKLYDASIDDSIPRRLEEAGISYEKIPRTGHNISTYFRFFDEYYDELPEWMCLTKGHMVGRHCTKEFWERVYNNKYFTYLYNGENAVDSDVAFVTMENVYVEKNDSWNMYVASPNHPHKYFDDYNRLLKFIYSNPIIPRYCEFAPGGCYIVSKSQVQKHSRMFYRNLNKIISYGLNPNFPSEAHQIERMLPIIFCSNYEENEWMDDEELFLQKLAIEEKITLENEKQREDIKQKKLWKWIK